jgi:hypothetical protein
MFVAVLDGTMMSWQTVGMSLCHPGKLHVRIDKLEEPRTKSAAARIFIRHDLAGACSGDLSIREPLLNSSFPGINPLWRRASAISESRDDSQYTNAPKENFP